MPHKRNSAASDVDLARFDLRIGRAMQSSARPGPTAECVATRSSDVAGAGDPLVAEAAPEPKVP